MREKRKIKIKNSFNLFFVFIISALLLISIGYANITDTVLNIKGEAKSYAQSNVFITDVQYLTSNLVNPNDSKIIDFVGKTLHTNVALSNKDATSTITYQITVYNGSTSTFAFNNVIYDDAFYSNKDITYTLENISHLEEIKPKQYKTFNITFKYLNGLSTNNILDAYLKIDFKQKCNVRYVNFMAKTNPPITLEGEPFVLDISSENIKSLRITMGLIELKSTEYTYVNGVITIPKVTGDIVIENNDLLTKNNSMYCWNDLAFYRFAIDSTLTSLNRLNVTDVYLSLGTRIEDVAFTERVVTKLNANRKNTYALTGSPSWYNSPLKCKTRIDKIDAYNQKVGETSKIKGIVLDIEGYVDATYKQDEITGFETFANTMAEVYAYAKTKNLKVVSCIPYWYEKYYTDVKFTEVERSRGLAAFEKLVQNCDKISVMNYYKTSMVEHIKEEIDVAKKYNKEVESIAEFSRPVGTSLPPTITFWGNATPLQDALATWKKVHNTYLYDKLNFSFHHLSLLSEITLEGKNITLEFVDMAGNKLTPATYKLAFANQEMYEGKTGEEITIPQNVMYNVVLDGYDFVEKVGEVSLGDGKIKRTYKFKKVGEQEKYTLEIYPKFNDASYFTFDYILRLKDTVSMEVQDIYFAETAGCYVARNIIADRKYTATVIDKNTNMEYSLLSGMAKNELGEKVNVLDLNKNIVIPKGFKNNLYTGGTFMFEKIPEGTTLPTVNYNNLETYIKCIKENGTIDSIYNVHAVRFKNVKVGTHKDAKIVGTKGYCYASVKGNVDYEVTLIDTAGKELPYKLEYMEFVDSKGNRQKIAAVNGVFTFPNNLDRKRVRPTLMFSSTQSLQ